MSNAVKRGKLYQPVKSGVSYVKYILKIVK